VKELPHGLREGARRLRFRSDGTREIREFVAAAFKDARTINSNGSAAARRRSSAFRRLLHFSFTCLVISR
jgi:hypothetical protein